MLLIFICPYWAAFYFVCWKELPTECDFLKIKVGKNLFYRQGYNISIFPKEDENLNLEQTQNRIITKKIYKN